MFAAEYAPAARPFRRSKRARIELDAPAEQSGMARTLCRVVDLSIHGCRLLTFSHMDRDQPIWLNLPGLGMIAAMVVWADDLVAGCVFQAPLSTDAFNALVSRHGLIH
ncbi:PilZ domain-containing protein [uncultured Sphingomonas sp.]|uniref:PilZ domain-containing protein n=1 Tax=uncultured Sphingomonas sp. TaxID=158754 RepID=UPI0025EC4413|nr:PilZ domain-containing protein [uncultured Sphingomonas sp.]